MASANWIEKELRRNFAKASRLGERLAKTEPRAASAKYLTRKEALQIKLTNGVVVQIPVKLISYLEGASPREISSVEVLGRGGGLHWENLDLDLGVPALVASAFGGPNWMAELGHWGGRSKSAAKSKAARNNGRKRARPQLAARPRTSASSRGAASNGSTRRQSKLRSTASHER